MDWDEATKALINDVAEAAAEKTVRVTLTGLGVDASNPIEVQADFHFIRTMRRTWQSTKSKSLLAALGLMVTGFFTFVWSAIRSSLGL